MWHYCENPSHPFVSFGDRVSYITRVSQIIWMAHTLLTLLLSSQVNIKFQVTIFSFQTWLLSSPFPPSLFQCRNIPRADLYDYFHFFAEKSFKRRKLFFCEFSGKKGWGDLKTTANFGRSSTVLFLLIFQDTIL